MSDTRQPRPHTAARVAALGDSEDPTRAGDEPEPGTPVRIKEETPEADAVEQSTDIVEDDTEQVWERGPEEADVADATDQKRGTGTPDEEEYR